MIVAAIDIGTNSVHTVIARVVDGHTIDILDREREVVQIGRGSFDGGRLMADAIGRTVDALTRAVDLARRHRADDILCTATAAVREAENGGEFLAAALKATGIAPRVIPAEEEGRLIYLGAASALRLPEAPCVVVDIGGGSMQLAAGRGPACDAVVSAPLGSLRLTEQLPLGDPPVPRAVARLERHVRSLVDPAVVALGAGKSPKVFGSSGSIHALAQIAAALDTGRPLAQVNGAVLTRTRLQRLARSLAKMTVPERERLPGIDARRAETIVAAASVLVRILQALRAPSITLTDFGVREGLVFDYAAQHATDLAGPGMDDDLRARSVLQLARKFTPDLRHAAHVVDLAQQLFDGLRSLHRLADADRELLRFAAWLHDIGSAIGHDRHAEHSAYIIRSSALRGLAEREVEMIALTARFHGKGRPRKSDMTARCLAPLDVRTVRWLAAMLRLAEAFDRSQYQLVETLTVVRHGKTVRIEAMAPREARLELWAAADRMGLLEKLLDRPLLIVRTEPARSKLRPVDRRQRGLAAGAPPARGSTRGATSAEAAEAAMTDAARPTRRSPATPGPRRATRRAPVATPARRPARRTRRPGSRRRRSPAE